MTPYWYTLSVIAQLCRLGGAFLTLEKLRGGRKLVKPELIDESASPKEWVAFAGMLGATLLFLFVLARVPSPGHV